MTVQQAFELGLQHHRAGQFPRAEALYRQVLALDSKHAYAYLLLGTIAVSARQFEAAADLIQRAIAIQPGFAEAHNNLGIAFQGMGRMDEAIAAYRQAIVLSPGYFEAYSNLGNALCDTGQLDAAVAAHQQTIALKPDLAEAHYNYAIALKETGRLDEAVAGYQRAIALQPRLARAYTNLGEALKDQGQLDEAIASYRRAIDLDPSARTPHDDLIFALHYHSHSRAATVAEELRHWNRLHVRQPGTPAEPHDNDRRVDRRLRIGYVSPDFRDHPVARFLLPLLAEHDRTRFELFAYPTTRANDAMSERLRSHIDHWHSLVSVSDTEAAEMIRGHRIDILVDLAMHTANNRLTVFALKPAPIQMTYLAYCSTTGLAAMDYRLSDPYLDPIGGDESFYTEQTIRPSPTYWCYQPPDDSPAVSDLPAIASGHVTFGCLNNFCKVSELAIETWIRLLHEVPGSQLLLHVSEGSHRERLRQRFQHAGIDADRLRFSGKVGLQEYLRLYTEIDLALDPFPYGGGTTTCDALWMGVPVVSLRGRTAVGRAGLSLLTNVGLPEFVAGSPETYVRIAARWASDISGLSQLRSTLRQQMMQSVLTDASKFAGNIEAAYEQMWRRWREQGGPSSLYSGKNR